MGFCKFWHFALLGSSHWSCYLKVLENVDYISNSYQILKSSMVDYFKTWNPQNIFLFHFYSLKWGRVPCRKCENPWIESVDNLRYQNYLHHDERLFYENRHPNFPGPIIALFRQSKVSLSFVITRRRQNVILLAH